MGRQHPSCSRTAAPPPRLARTLISESLTRSQRLSGAVFASPGRVRPRLRGHGKLSGLLCVSPATRPSRQSPPSGVTPALLDPFGFTATHRACARSPTQKQAGLGPVRPSERSPDPGDVRGRPSLAPPWSLPRRPGLCSSLLNCSQHNDRVSFLSLYRGEQLGVNKLADESGYFRTGPDSKYF